VHSERPVDVPAFPVGHAKQSARLSCLVASLAVYSLYFPFGQFEQVVLAVLSESLYLPWGQTAQVTLSEVYFPKAQNEHSPLPCAPSVDTLPSGQLSQEVKVEYFPAVQVKH